MTGAGTLSKATGGAAYTLALPAAAPAANTYLGYTDTTYAWGAGTNSAAVYLFATSDPNQDTPSSPYNIKFPRVIVSSGISATSPTTFSIPAGGTYRLSGCVTLSTNVAYLFYANVSPIGEAAQNKGDLVGMSNPIALAYLTTTTTKVSLTVYGRFNITILGNDTTGGMSTGRGPWIEILQLGNNTAISQFTGATSAANGAIGYIPAPQAGQQNHYLSGGGSWQPVCPAFATYCSYAASGTNLLFAGVNTKTLASRGINIDSGGTKIIPTVAGYYECRASWNSGGGSANSNINIAFNGGGFLTYGTSQVGVYQSGVVEAIILFNDTTDYIQITNIQWNFCQAQVNIKWFSS